MKQHEANIIAATLATSLESCRVPGIANSLATISQHTKTAKHFAAMIEREWNDRLPFDSAKFIREAF